MKLAITSWRPLLVAALALGSAAPLTAQVTAIRAGRLVDPEAGTVAANQVILIEKGKFTAIGPGPGHPARRRGDRPLRSHRVARPGGRP